MEWIDVDETPRVERRSEVRAPHREVAILLWVPSGPTPVRVLDASRRSFLVVAPRGVLQGHDDGALVTGAELLADVTLLGREPRRLRCGVTVIRRGDDGHLALHVSSVSPEEADLLDERLAGVSERLRP